MGLLGISLIVASVVYVIVRPPAWLSPMLFRWIGLGGAAAADPTGSEKKRREEADTDEDTAPRIQDEAVSNGSASAPSDAPKPPPPSEKKARDRAAMPPPPLPPPTVQPPTIQPPTIQPPMIQPPTIQPPTIQPPTIDEPQSPTTPKASATRPSQAIPGFTLSGEPPAPSSAPKPSSATMPLPPPRGLPSAGHILSLPQFPAANSVQRARGPVPNRGPPSRSPGGLAPPPTHSSRPQKPSRKVTLDPGHSPLDWARILGSGADLRGLAPSTPYMRVPPSLLKEKTGRRGKDAWMAVNDKVYNITPYAKFHPGGVPELMRGAGRDGTRLFGEIHPWVNYETMLASCLVGLLVEEPEAGSQESDMDKMD
ncbi:Cytochrome b5 reductase 4 [Tolypocladium ophioglossoides CBS 100239]|uniref:Cytochrome b5 reductase 4 n=1 Tax=Tolypocladium ophioglossoides (strain CBS 100239) TaxID=1163406 RepID=A0A0L0NA74_TOLOC|nr:Cytochrome b5 reductase 4 [Tolypocladium ophioglossoides CBS 100239]